MADEQAEPKLTRTERRKIATHDALLDAVRDLMIEHVGPEFTVTDVTDLADVAQGTFYNHFEDRDAAIRAAVQRDVTLHDDIAALIAKDDQDAIADIAGIFGVNIHHAMFKERWPRFALAAYVMRQFPSPHRPGPTHEAIERGIAEGTIGITDVDYGYSMTRHLLVGLAERLTSEEPLDFEFVLRSHLLACASLLDFDPDRVPELVEWLVDSLADQTWD